MIFDYSRIIELLFDAFLKKKFKIYNYLFNSRYEYLFSIDFKYIYLTILFYLNDRHYFVFIIFKIDQIQLKRIQQKL